MTYIIADIGTTLTNVTGDGTTYIIDWNGTIDDPFSYWSSNALQLQYKTFVTVTAYLKLGGMSAVNGLLDILLNTADGDIPLISNNPTGGLIASNYDFEVTRMLVLNPNEISSYNANLKVKVNGLTKTVDILQGSKLAFYFQ